MSSGRPAVLFPHRRDGNCRGCCISRLVAGASPIAAGSGTGTRSSPVPSPSRPPSRTSESMTSAVAPSRVLQVVVEYPPRDLDPTAPHPITRREVGGRTVRVTRMDRKLWIECSGNTRQSGRDGNKKRKLPIPATNATTSGPEVGRSGQPSITPAVAPSLSSVSVRVSESRSQRIQMNDGRFETLDKTRASRNDDGLRDGCSCGVTVSHSLPPSRCLFLRRDSVRGRVDSTCTSSEE